MKRSNLYRLLLSYCVIAALVVSIIILIAGVPASYARSKLPSGLDVKQVPIKNVLVDGEFDRGQPLATGWLQEHSTAGAPAYLRPGQFQEIIYNGVPGDRGPKRKIEIFQAIWKDIKPGQRWRFTIEVRGTVSKSYVDVGMEWFSVFKHTVNDVTAYGYHYLNEHDEFPPVQSFWQRVTDTSPPLPAQARCVAVYVQLPEINSATKVDIEVRAASMGLLPRNRPGGVAGSTR